MTVRLMLLPVVLLGPNSDKRVPKYLRNKWNPTGIDVPYANIDYGLVERTIVAADLTPAQVGQAEAQADVYMMPEDIDQNLGSSEVLDVANFLDNSNAPSGWVSTSLTWRDTARQITAFFMYMQLLTNLAQTNPLETGIPLTRTYGSLSQAWQDWIKEAAVERGTATEEETIPAGWTIGRILEEMGSRWGDQPIVFSEIFTL